jgi:hypothetical protein
MINPNKKGTQTLSGESANSKQEIIGKPTNYKIILSHLAQGKSLNKFEAERLGDHCLNTTISNIFIKYQITAQRKNEKVKTRFGSYATVKRYWLSDDDIIKIQPLIKG